MLAEHASCLTRIIAIASAGLYSPRNMNQISERTRWSAAIIGYGLYAVLTLSPVWSGRVEPKWDGRDFNYPAFAYAGDAIKDGRLPLWNPFSNCGEPFISDPAYLWYQPAATAAALLRRSPFDGYMLFWTGIWAWSGYGALLLAAVLGAGPLGGFVAAVSFSFSGFFVGHGQHLPFVVTAAWFPWVLAFGHAAVSRRSRALTLLAGAALGLSALGGYAGLVVFECLALTLWLVLAFLGPWSRSEAIGASWKDRARWVMGVLGVSGALLVLIWSPSLYAFLVEARDFTDRTKPVTDELALYGNPFPLTAAVSFLFPRVVVERYQLFPSDVSMINAYLGALALPFAVLGLDSGGRRRWWVLVFACFWLVVSLGGTAGLRTVLHLAVPATRFMRHNGMLRALFLAPLAALAGVGLTSAFSGRPSRRSRVVAAWLALTCLVAGSTAALLGPGALVLGWVAPGILAALVALAASVLSRSQRTSLAGATIVATVFAVDLAWHTRTNSFTEWQSPPPVSLRDIERYGSNFDPLMPRLTDPTFHRSKLNLLNHIPVVEGYVALRSASFDALVQSRFSQVLALRRYWLSPSAWRAPEREVGVASLARFGSSDPIPVFVEPREEGDPELEVPVVPGSFGAVRVSRYEPERIELSVEVPGTRDAVLASTERLSPSWRVYVDGVRREISQVNYFFRGVRVPPGRHDVRFEYAPRTFIWLLALGYGSLILTLALATWMWRRDGSSASKEPGRNSANALGVPARDA